VIIAASAAALMALAVPNVASAQTVVFNVDTTSDGNDGECTADCTLREAVSLATAQGNSISLPAGVYKLTLGELVLRNNTRIIGAGLTASSAAGARTTIIDAQGRSRVINVPANTATVVAGVTLTGGRADDGAGVLIGNNGGLVLVNAVVEGNVATGLGGGVHLARGSLDTVGTAISSNRAGNGGGVAADTQSDVGITASTVTGNTASGLGGGIFSVGNVSLQQATIANNSAQAGGAVYMDPTASGRYAIANTILAGAGSDAACGGAVATASHIGWTGNIADDATCAFAVAEGRQSLDPRLGPLKNNRGPTDTMALLQGSPAIDTGNLNACFTRDQRGAAAVGTCDVGAFEFGGQVPEPQLPPPVAGETINASLSKGTVKVKLPGSDDFFVLQDGQQLPMGTTFDTTRGRVNIRADQGHGVANKKAWFYQGVFKVKQTKGKKPLTTLTMTGKLQCGGKGKAGAALKKKKTRRLWGNGKGRFSTKGKHSAATVVGTKWLVEDRCNGTLTKVVSGVVKVRDFKKRKTVTVRAGHSYFARR
jgi:CSLREA domain-containing protein